MLTREDTEPTRSAIPCSGSSRVTRIDHCQLSSTNSAWICARSKPASRTRWSSLPLTKNSSPKHSAGAIGIGHKTGQLAALDELSERTGVDRLLSRLLAAWAAAELGHGDGTIPESVLRDHETTATVVTVGRNRWVEHVGDRRRLQRDSRNDVAEYLVARYCGQLSLHPSLTLFFFPLTKSRRERAIYRRKETEPTDGGEGSEENRLAQSSESQT